MDEQRAPRSYGWITGGSIALVAGIVFAFLNAPIAPYLWQIGCALVAADVVARAVREVGDRLVQQARARD